MQMRVRPRVSPRLGLAAVALLALATTSWAQDNSAFPSPPPATTPHPDRQRTGKLNQFQGFYTPRPLPANANFVYASVWASWSAWSFCVNNVQIRVRACNTVRGFTCPGPNQERKSCGATPNRFEQPLRHARLRVGTDYDTVDPWEEDRREALKQLYSDYTPPEAPQGPPKNVHGIHRKLIRPQGDFASVAVQRGAPVLSGGGGYGSPPVMPVPPPRELEFGRRQHADGEGQAPSMTPELLFGSKLELPTRPIQSAASSSRESLEAIRPANSHEAVAREDTQKVVPSVVSDGGSPLQMHRGREPAASVDETSDTPATSTTLETPAEDTLTTLIAEPPEDPAPSTDVAPPAPIELDTEAPGVPEEGQREMPDHTHMHSHDIEMTSDSSKDNFAAHVEVEEAAGPVESIDQEEAPTAAAPQVVETANSHVAMPMEETESSTPEFETISGDQNVPDVATQTWITPPTAEFETASLAGEVELLNPDATETDEVESQAQRVHPEDPRGRTTVHELAQGPVATQAPQNFPIPVDHLQQQTAEAAKHVQAETQDQGEMYDDEMPVNQVIGKLEQKVRRIEDDMDMLEQATHRREGEDNHLHSGEVIINEDTENAFKWMLANMTQAAKEAAVQQARLGGLSATEVQQMTRQFSGLQEEPEANRLHSGEIVYGRRNHSGEFTGIQVPLKRLHAITAYEVDKPIMLKPINPEFNKHNHELKPTFIRPQKLTPPTPPPTPPPHFTTASTLNPEAEELESDLAKLRAQMAHMRNELALLQSEQSLVQAPPPTTPNPSAVERALNLELVPKAPKLPSGPLPPVVTDNQGEVFLLDSPKDKTAASWSAWREWGDCFCDKQVRTRVCNYDSGFHSKGCAGKSFETRPCVTTRPCPAKMAAAKRAQAATTTAPHHGRNSNPSGLYTLAPPTGPRTGYAFQPNPLSVAVSKIRAMFL